MTTSRYAQYNTAFWVALSLVYQGVILAWPSPVLPKLLEGETDVEITRGQCSWLVSLVALGALPGCLLTLYLGDNMGIKKTMFALAIPGVIGSAMMLCTNTTVWICVARFICGIAASMAMIEVTIYISEIADIEIRGALGSLVVGTANIGGLIMYGIGPFVSFTCINWICLFTPIIFVLPCFWIHESPYYHMKNGKFEAAGMSLMKFRGATSIEEIQEELFELQEQVKKDVESRASIRILLFKREYRRAVIIMTGLIMLQQLSGTLAIQGYLETIFMQTSMNISGAVASVIYGIVQLCGGITAAFLIERVGRKPLLLLSAFGTGIALTAVGLYFYIQSITDESTMNSIAWLPVGSITGFGILFALGMGNIPSVLQTELFPTNVRNAATSFFTAGSVTTAFFVSNNYQGLADLIGINIVFWIFAAVSYTGVLFIYFLVPETKGRSIEEIVQSLDGSKKRDVEHTALEVKELTSQND